MDVSIVPTAEGMHAAGREAAIATGARLVDPAATAAALAAADVVVDGIVGIGRRGALRGRAREVVALAADLSPRPIVVAVDVPSGINPDTGAVPGDTILEADVTVTFGGVKAGLLRPPASRYAGRIHLVDIGLDLPASTRSSPRAAQPG